MMEIRKVLFPTDFSDTARGALPHALELARVYRAELVLLHVRTPHRDDPNRRDFQTLERDHDAFLGENLKQLSEQALSCGWVSTAIIRDFSPADGILHFVRENDVDLTVMGTHGRSAVGHFFLGSVAEQVVRHSPSPVLTVACSRSNYRNKTGYSNILVAFDFSRHSLEAAIKARDLARECRTRLHVLYVVEQSVPPAYYGIWRNSFVHDLPRIREEARKVLASALGDISGAEIHVRISETTAHSEIARHASRENMDLIVMGTHGFAGLERVLLGSTTERVVRIAGCPVLTVKLQTELDDEGVEDRSQERVGTDSRGS